MEIYQPLGLAKGEVGLDLGLCKPYPQHLLGGLKTSDMARTTWALT